MKSTKVVLKDIARAAGVSTATVSYVLNDNPMAARISQETADRIRAVASSLQYQPNQIAKSLKTRRTNTFGLIVADIANPFSAQLARIIEDEAKNHGFTVLFGSSDESLEKTRDLLKTLINYQVDGLILAAVDGSAQQVSELRELGVPFVLIDRYFPGQPFPYVAIDNYAASADAARQLLNNGRRHFGLIGYDTTLFHLQERHRGFTETVMAAQGSMSRIQIGLVTIPNVRTDVEQALERMLNGSEPVDALFFTTNLLAMHGLRYLKRHGVAIPDKLALIAFDESDGYDLFPVSIAHIRQPLAELGLRATHALIALLNDPERLVQLNLETTYISGVSAG